ncbi:TIM44-like domain-containing protein [Caldimonas thermodepolymerans]|uniref:Lipid-binding transport protein (Tim44 family) n=1 Tax=Caldimonas thermodepolymerans TaxID=215580 RepID=A0AA46DDK3_9BURK|nr:TIM44-like domain-containing protein [Caldimonas thermodepolymerans]TCP06320.1 putative lipid-binding transport protein (Tim44 family) [Caldimonas thermodepolymerans]UZG49078.1 Tim44-like domain-containing protein [Caldimonas thermodepolymerans]
MITSKLAAFCLAALMALASAVQARPAAGQETDAGGVVREAEVQRQDVQALPPLARTVDGEPGMVAGLATGLGVAGWLHGFGVGPQAAGWFSMALGAVLLLSLAWGVWRYVRRPALRAASLSFPSAGTGTARTSSFASSHYEPATLAPESTVHYGPESVADVAGQTGEFRWGVPEGFDTDAFLRTAKRNFVLLQEAWDHADLETLRSLMTDEMLAHIRQQLAERGDQPNRTDVVTLSAEMLGVEDVGAGYIASVEFSGMIREEISAGASPFREIWNLTRPKDGSTGWLLAGVQALD